MRKNCIVIDTNVFISAIIGQQGFSRKIFDDIVLTGDAKLCLSMQVFTEYNEVCNRPRFLKIDGFSERAATLLKAILQIAAWFEPAEKVRVLPDEDDDMFIELALEAEAAYIISGNTNDFIISSYRDILIRTPKAFYEEWMSSDS